MATYLFTWNPENWLWKDLSKRAKSVKNGKNQNGTWSCGNTKKILEGDRFFLFKQGKNLPKGIFGSGYITKPVFRGEHWSETDKSALYVGIKFDTLLNPEIEPILERDFLVKDNTFSRVNWNTQRSGIEIYPEIASELEEVWQNFSEINQVYLPEEIEEKESKEIFEGAKRIIQVNAYERSLEARKICIEKYKAKCAVCDFDFNKFYGEEIAQNYIHVHHLKQLSEIGEKYKINPVKDLRPVCPNCHAIIHRRNPPYSIKQVKDFIKEQKKHR